MDSQHLFLSCKCFLIGRVRLIRRGGRRSSALIKLLCVSKDTQVLCHIYGCVCVRSGRQATCLFLIFPGRDLGKLLGFVLIQHLSFVGIWKREKKGRRVGGEEGRRRRKGWQNARWQDQVRSISAVDSIGQLDGEVVFSMEEDQTGGNYTTSRPTLWSRSIGGRKKKVVCHHTTSSLDRLV